MMLPEVQLVLGAWYRVTDTSGCVREHSLSRIIHYPNHDVYEFNESRQWWEIPIEYEAGDICDIVCISRYRHADGTLITAEEWLHDITLDPGAEYSARQANRPSQSETTA